MRARRTRRNSTPILLLFLCAILGLVVYLELEEGWSIFEPKREADRIPIERSATSTGQPQIEAEHAPAAVFDMPPLRSYAEIVQRPLFSATRRPPAPASVESVPQAVPELPPIRFLLTGLIVSPEERVALIRPSDGSAVMRVMEGQEVEQWVVEEILPDRVIVRRNGTAKEVFLLMDVP
jgi:type II secretory pathway component PulC